MQRNILEYLEQTVIKSPDKTAVITPDETITFYELYKQAQSIGSSLHKKGYYKQPAAVFMKKNPRTIAAFLGSIYAGCYYIPIDTEMPAHRIELILRQINCNIFICDDETEPILHDYDFHGKILKYNEIAFNPINMTALHKIRTQQIDTDPIYIVFTSGSTGIPKGVIGYHRALIDYIENLCNVMQFSENTIFGNQTPLYFDACLKEIIPALKHGATVNLIPRQLFMFPMKLLEYLNEYKINTLCWVVSALTFLSSTGALNKMPPKYLQTIAFASEVFPVRQFNLWKKALPEARFINLYGPTETTGICCFYEVRRLFHEHESIPIGQPFPNTEIMLLNEQNELAAFGESGEICIRGSRLTHGYYGDNEKTSEVFVQNPLNTLYPERIYRTGDIGKYNEHGELIFVSRKDHQIKHMGHRIELGEIEMTANMHDSVSGVCCIYNDKQNKLILYYVGGVSVHDIAVYLKQKLPSYMLPQQIKQLKTLPYTPNGKIDRKLLKEGNIDEENKA